MAKRKTPPPSNGAGPLAVLSALDRVEYVRRLELREHKRLELQAAETYLNVLGEEFRDRYGLPFAYDLNLQTGEVSARG